MKKELKTVYVPVDGKYCDFIVKGYDDSYENDVKKEEGYFFSATELNEYIAEIIKKSLEIASNSAELEFCGNPYDLEDQSYCVSTDSIKNSFEETFKKLKI